MTQEQIKLNTNSKICLSQAMSAYNSGRQNAASIFYHRFESGMHNPEVLTEGVLLKQNVNRAFKSRYFVLYKNRKLAYWPSQTEHIYGKDPMGMMEMSDIRNVIIVNKPPKSKKKKQSEEGDAEDDIGDDIVIDFEKTRYFCFELQTKYRTHLLCCDDALHFNDWIMHLNNAVFGKKLYKGWFIKQGAKAKSWKKRWFVVYDTLEMRYYENAKGTKPKGSIFLSVLTEIKMVLNTDKYPKHQYVMELITPDRNWVLSAPSQDDRQKWFSQLCKLIGTDSKMECYRLNPIHSDYLFQYNEKTKTWIHLYCALTHSHFYYFQSSEKCQSAQSIAYFDKASFHIGISKNVSVLMPFDRKPIFQICDEGQCKLFNKQHLFQINTSFNNVKASLLMSTAHRSELIEWKNALAAVKIAGDNSDSNNFLNVQSNVSSSQSRIRSNCFSDDLLNMSQRKAPPKMNKHKRSLSTNDEEKDGYPQTRLPAPKPRRRQGKKRKKSGNTLSVKHYRPPKITGAGNVGKIDPFKHKTPKTKVPINRSRTRSKSFNEQMMKNMYEHSVSEKTISTNQMNANGGHRSIVSTSDLSHMQVNDVHFEQQQQTRMAKLSISVTPFRHESFDSQTRYNEHDVNEPEFSVIESIAVPVPLYQSESANMNLNDANEMLSDEDNECVLSEDEKLEIDQLCDAAQRGYKYFEKGLWTKAIKEFNIAINAVDVDDEYTHDSIYKWYCIRSECYRKLKKYEKALIDTERWMKLRFDRSDFDYLKGCGIASAVYIDNKQFAKAKKVIHRALEINPKHEIFQKRLVRINEILEKECNERMNEIDDHHLEYDHDEIIIEEKNEKDAMAESNVITEWKSLIGNKTRRMLEIESKKLKLCVPSSAQVSQCPCVQRLMCILRFYDKWCKLQETATILDRISIYDNIHYLKSYGLCQLMNDFIHIKEAHIDQSPQDRSILFDYFISVLPEVEDLASDKCFIRNNRNKFDIDQNEEKLQKMYFNFSRSGEAHDIITMQILDSIHCFCVHSSQCIMMQLPQQQQGDENESEGKIFSAFLSEAQSAMQNVNEQYAKTWKFKTNLHNDQNQNGISIGKSISLKDKLRIKPKYKTLKRELLNNAIFRITEPEWFCCLMKANILKQTYKGKMWKAKNCNGLNAKHQIPEGMPIPITHLMVLLLYTNNDNLQYSLKHIGASSQSSNESFAKFRKRNREIFNFLKIMEECIIFYGHTNHEFMANAIFYHSIPRNLLFDSFFLRINAPCLITLEPSLAMTICNDSNNAILQFRAQTNSINDCMLLDVSWLSDNPQNNAFVSTQSMFHILDIITDYEQNEIFISALILFKRLISGHYIESLMHPQFTYQYIALGLMSNHSEGYAEHSNIPRFIQQIFDCIIGQIDNIFIIKSQFEKLTKDFRSCFFDIDEEESVLTGPFYDYWAEQNMYLTVNLTQEFEWNVTKQSEVLKFWNLAINEQMDGPECNYIVVDDDEEDEANDINEIFLCFVPFIKRAHAECKDNICFGITLKDFGEEYSSVKVQYNALFTQSGYTLSKEAEFEEDGQSDECIAFHADQMKALNSFHFQFSLRVLSLS